MKSRFFSVPGEKLLLPACVLAFLTVGCAPDESPMPNGAYVPETKNVSPAPRPVKEEIRNAAVPAGKSAEESDFDVSELDLSTPDVHESPSVIPEKTTPPAPAATPAPAPAASAKTGTAYKIRKGDSLSRIAHRNGITARALADYNGIALNKTLIIGSTLYIPAYAGAPKQAAAVKETPVTLPKKTAKAAPADCVEYVVQPGDSLSRIAYRHSMKMSKLMEMNGLNEKSKLFIGQKLLLPKDAKLRTPAPAVRKAVVSTAPAGRKTTPVKTAAVPVSTVVAAPDNKIPADKESSVDDILNSIGSDAQQPVQTNLPAKKVSPKPAAATPEPAAPAASAAVDDATVITLPLDHEMTLEEVARTYEKDIQSLKLLNPDFSEEQKLKAGTMVRMSMF